MSQGVDHFFYTNFEILPDPRTKDWFPVTNFNLAVVLVAAYLIFCLFLGPLLMKNREPMQLKNSMAGYNLTMVLVSAYVAFESFMGGWGTHYRFFCHPIGAPDDKNSLRMAKAHYVYFVSKFVELMDTVFFVLRKKYSHITFLHVYHHGVVVLMAFCSLRYLPDGHGTLIVLLNSLIHVIMYAYYFLAGLGPKMQKYLWWKKYLTSMQLVQFLFTLSHAAVVFHPSCNYPKPLVIVLMINSGMFLLLFANFYRKSYKKEKNEEGESHIKSKKSKKNK
ncbi:elongation of very long chain fatty acids protein 7-like [Neocloeon triangulifer]|uniref:elongation of very long chain fatty acids protein 7-like n=1 Tax=Neocloeon triangulifer TaxID=2078957 RepID=UPI00286F126E|nr:elongation of very long chain fatty acids protein 7-like [Neocloeon triangulifer]